MADIIHLMSDTLANQIAAGEVIQRPASAVKELLENSVDSGAKKIHLIIKESGKALIQVVDDGCGMSETDARMAFERHATSKINSIDDLFAIRTMGFRGEAMASIAAISQVELKTRQTGEELGTRILIEGSKIKEQESCQTTDGTSISIRNLFFNTPARRNFLKTNPVETRHIIEEFQHIALANPDIHFNMHHNGVEVFHLTAGNLRQRIVSLFGKNHDQRLVPVSEKTDVITLHGFVGKPEFAKKTRGEQFFFVNQRFIKSNYLNHAVYNAYENILAAGTFPFFTLFMEIHPEHIDINVHPTKQEIKFDEEKLIYAIIRASVKHALSQYSVTPSLDFDQEDHLNRMGSFTPNFTPSEQNSTSKYSNSGPGTLSSTRPENSASSGLKHWEKLYEIARHSDDQSVTIPSKWSYDDLQEDDEIEPAERRHFQVHDRYILTQIKSGFILIDQQAAHERILYERYLAALEKTHMASQKQLFPKSIELPPADAELMRELLPEINKLGFDLQEFGKNTFISHALPPDMKNVDEKELIERLLEDYKQNLSELKLEKRDSLARSIAKRTAIKAGKRLNPEEIRNLIDELFACKSPYYNPEGKFTLSSFDFEELEARLKNK